MGDKAVVQARNLRLTHVTESGAGDVPPRLRTSGLHIVRSPIPRTGSDAPGDPLQWSTPNL